MTQGYQGTFVISWSQTEVDGVAAPPLRSVTAGVAWRWTGRAVRVDGARDLLVLHEAEGTAELRRRAARMVRRLVGAALEGVAFDGARGLADLGDPGAAPSEEGFSLTDGRRVWTATLIPVRDSARLLIMFAGDIPPAGADLWVVEADIGATALSGQAGGLAATEGGIICFTPGTLIATPDGPRPIEHLREGQRVLTVDNGPQEIIWTGQRRLSGARLFAMPHLRPIRIRQAALGGGRPELDLLVSPQHRMLLRGPRARALFNADEVLVAAEHLIDDRSVFPDGSLREVTYVHLLLEAHQVIIANGLETESFHPANAAFEALDPVDRAELESIMPGLAADPHGYGAYARRNLTASEAAVLRFEAA